MLASRRAISKLVSFSRWVPTPLVKKSCFGTYIVLWITPPDRPPLRPLGSAKGRADCWPSRLATGAERRPLDRRRPSDRPTDRRAHVLPNMGRIGLDRSAPLNKIARPTKGRAWGDRTRIAPAGIEPATSRGLAWRANHCSTTHPHDSGWARRRKVSFPATRESSRSRGVRSPVLAPGPGTGLFPRPGVGSRLVTIGRERGRGCDSQRGAIRPWRRRRRKGGGLSCSGRTTTWRSRPGRSPGGSRSRSAGGRSRSSSRSRWGTRWPWRRSASASRSASMARSSGSHRGRSPSGRGSTSTTCGPTSSSATTPTPPRPPHRSAEIVEARTFRGFLRPDGRVGTRNYVAVISARSIARRAPPGFGRRPLPRRRLAARLPERRRRLRHHPQRAAAPSPMGGIDHTILLERVLAGFANGIPTSPRMCWWGWAAR